jgi:CheY-like chemotaxis protein
MKFNIEKEVMSRKPRILVVDDDPGFRALAVQAGLKRDVHVTACGTLQELSIMADGFGFDVAIVDYFLDDLKRTLSGPDVASLMLSTPTILVSSTNQGVDDNQSWPTCIREFLNKKSGINSIMDHAIALYSRNFAEPTNG